MLKKAIKKMVSGLGYEIRRTKIDHGQQHRALRKRQFLKEDGSFDYERYRHVQTEGNKRKIHGVWVNEENVAFLSEYIRSVVGQPRFGLCHGTRRGKEQEWFRKYLGCDVLGTEISDTAEDFPDTIQWDFHETKPEWIDATDFIYSNSLDHSYDPETCLNAWMSCVRKGGICILEHSSGPGQVASERDPFKAELIAMPYAIATWSKGKYGVREIIEAPKQKERLCLIHFIVIQRL